MLTIGARIKARREELRISQEELAKKLGYKSRSSVNKIELDSRNLTQSKIKAIADALETTPSYIMGWEETSPAGGMTGEADAQRARIEKAIAMLSAENKEQLLQYAEFLAQQEAKKGGQ